MPPTGPQLVHAIKRNFGGLEETGLDPEQMFFQRLPSNIDEPPDLASIDPEVSVVINPRHSCARVTVVVLCVCLSFTALAAYIPGTNDTHRFLLGFSWILEKPFHSKVMA